jgi:hypothetical protein
LIITDISTATVTATDIMGSSRGLETDRSAWLPVPSCKTVRFAILLIPPFIVHSAHGESWRIEPYFFGSQIYDSNVTLGSTGASESAFGARKQRDSFVTLLMPGIMVRHNGPWKFSLDYSMQNLFYAGNYSSARISNYLQMGAHGKLVEDAVFLNLTSTIGQYNGGVAGNGGFGTGAYQIDNISRTGNTTAYRTVRINPYWTPHLGGYVEGIVGVSYSNFSTSGGGSSDSNMVAEYVNLNSGKESNVLGWRANFVNQDNYRSNGSGSIVGNDDITYRSYNGEVRYRWSEQLQPFIQAGSFQNNFGGQNNRSDNVNGARNGSYWNAGLIWAPSRKTFLQAGYGPNNYFASLRWNPSRRTDLTFTFRNSNVGGYGAGGYGGGGYGGGGYGGGGYGGGGYGGGGYGGGGYGGGGYGGGGFSSYGVGSSSGCAGGMSGGIGGGMGSIGGTGGMGGLGGVGATGGLGGGGGTGGLGGFGSMGGGFGGFGGIGGGISGFGGGVGQLGGFNAGTTWNAALCHRTRLTTWQAVYSEYITTTQQVLVDQPVSPDFIPIDQPNLTNEVITRKRGQAAVNVHFSKTNITLTGYRENRNYQFSGDQDVLGVTAAWSWRFAPRTSSQLMFAWQSLDNRPVSQKKYTSDFMLVSLGVYRSITPDINGGLSFWHSETGPDSSAGSYSDNRVTANVFVRF